MRWVIAFAFVFVGCVASVPGDTSITADLACETARMVVLTRSQLPPSPAPAPSGDKCENCNGSGKVRSGDGIAVFTCPVCKGTGKATK